MKTIMKNLGKHALLLLIIITLVVSTSISALPPENTPVSQHPKQNQTNTQTTPQTTDTIWVGYDNGINHDSVGLKGGGTFEWGIRLTPEELRPYAGNKISIIRHHHGLMGKDEPYTTSGDVRIYDEGTTIKPGALLTSEQYTVTEIGWYDVTLTESIPIPAGKDLWITLTSAHSQGQFPAGCDPGPMVPEKGGFITMDGETWHELTEYKMDFNWNLQAGFEEPLEIIDIKGGIGVSAEVKNINDGPVSNICWNITITGGILGLVDKNKGETIPQLASEEVVTIKSGLVLGLGSINVTVSIKSDEGVTKRQDSGMIIGPFVQI